MAVSYLGALENVFGQGLTSGIASQTGEPEQNVTRGLKSSVAAVFAGLVGKLGDVRGFQGIYEMITSRDDVALLREYDDPTSFAARFATGDSAVPNVVTQFTSAIFGTRTTQVGDLVARESGLSANTTAKLLPLASGFVMNFLRRRIVTDGLNLNTFRDTLLGQKDEIMRAAPAGLTEVLGAQPAPEEMRTVNDVREREVSYERIEADRRYRETPRETRRETERELRADRAQYSASTERHGHGHRWLWTTLGALALVAILWSSRDRHERRVARRTTVDTTFSAGEVSRVITPKGDVAGVMVSKTLPNGKTINIATNGAETKLIGFLSDPNKRVDETSWFALDRLHFAPGSAHLSADSEQQIQDLASVMTAYPNTAAKIGGFTDNTGNARVNVRLSQRRANAVREALVAKGVSPSRLVAEGYGAKMPIGDNSTADGRAMNRRISILVTKK